jgi:hypothetical protein
VLTGKAGLSLDKLDDVAHALKMTVSELVRKDGYEPDVLRPSEVRLLRAIRRLPVPIRDHLIILADYLVGVMPDEIDLLTLFRKLRPEFQERLFHAAEVLQLTQTDEARSAPSATGPTVTAQETLHTRARGPRAR